MNASSPAQIQSPCQRLLVINQYYIPDVASTGRYAAEICKGLVKRGFEVHVVTGQPSYTTSSPEAPPFEILDGVHIHRVSLGGARGRERVRTRVKGYLRFLWGAWWKAKELVNSIHPDTVLTFHNPPFVATIGAYLASRYGLRFVYAPYDIHPDALTIGGWNIPRAAVRIWDLINHWVFKQTDKVIVLARGAKQTLLDKGIPSEKVHVIPLWAIPELQPMSPDSRIHQELGINGNELLLLYAGNMGIMHPIEPILEAATLLRESPVHFLFVGGGVKKQYLVSKIEKENLSQVYFLPYQPETRFVQLLAASDACFVAFKPGMERITVPSRAYTFLSAGKPLITIMSPEADIARLVNEKGCGWNVTAGQELANLVRQLLNNPQEFLYRGQKAREIYEEQFRRERIVDEYAKVLWGNV
jgi:glycosyltransferase involved in cell wall biosynthesis